MSSFTGSPDEYVRSLSGWPRAAVEVLRNAVRSAAEFDEKVKWGHLVYFAHGPALLIRAHRDQVRLGFWRGQRMIDIEPRLRPGGKYEMATMIFAEAVPINPPAVRRLAARAVYLNARFGDPTKVVGSR